MPYLCLWRRNFCVTGECFFSYSGAIFERSRSLFSLTAAAQNMHVFLRKSPLFKEHFFGWLKTANISIVCGTVTLKSLLPQAFAVSNVHPRLRKRPPRCTLDCGFKTSESPALRGFVAGAPGFTTAVLYPSTKIERPKSGRHRPQRGGFRPGGALPSLRLKPAHRARTGLWAGNQPGTPEPYSPSFPQMVTNCLSSRRLPGRRNTHRSAELLP